MRAGAKTGIKLSGLVLPGDWDEQGEVTDVVIHLADESEYPVSPRGRGPELTRFCNHRIRVWGTLRLAGGRKVVDVADYEILPPASGLLTDWPGSDEATWG